MGVLVLKRLQYLLQHLANNKDHTVAAEVQNVLPGLFSLSHFYNTFIFVMTNWNFFFVKFFYKIYENSTVGNDLKCHIIVTAKMNEFSKRSKASISKQKKQPNLKAFKKIKKEITHGDNGNVNT
jgi:hypothetical protein